MAVERVDPAPNARRGAAVKADRWYAEGTRFTHEMPSVGALIAHEHRALRVVAHHPRDDGSTSVHVRREYGPALERENSRGECGLRVQGRPMWQLYTSERIPLCSCCGHPWPCGAMMDERRAMDAMRAGADLIARANDGCCLSCGEPITTRQRHILAPEPNVLIPGFGPPSFHLRQSCRRYVEQYDRARRDRLGADWSPLIRRSDPLPLASPSASAPH